MTTEFVWTVDKEGWYGPTPRLLEEIQFQDKAGLAPTASPHLYKEGLTLAKRLPQHAKNGKELLRNLLDPANSGRVNGVGIAFPQLALASKRNYRIFSMLVGLPDIKRANVSKGKLTIFENASYEGIASAGRTKKLESCLSAPGLMCEVWRWNKIWAKYSGQEGRVLLEGIDAWIFQHETDHNNGFLCHDVAFSQKLGVYYTPPEFVADFPVSKPSAWRYPVSFAFWQALKQGIFDFRRRPHS